MTAALTHRRHNPAMKEIEAPKPQISMISSTNGHPENEKRSFHFFQHVTALWLSGDFDGIFWKVLVLR